MFTVDFSTSISVYLGLFMAVLFLVWLLARRQSTREKFLDSKFIWFCSVCTHTYVNTKEDPISVCPRCGSFNKKDGAA